MKNILAICGLTFLSMTAMAQEAVVNSTPAEAPAVAVEPTPTPSPAPVAKTESKDVPLRFFGDFRYRHQIETQEPKEQRTIQRIQARFGVQAQVHDNLKFTLRLMTGSSANSGNQTLGDEKAPGMPRRSFGLDQAFFDYQPIEDLSIYGGRMVQPFNFAGKSQMLLDRDISLEGMGLKFTQELVEDLSFYTQGGMFWIRENYDSQFGEDQTDNFLNGIQVGLQWKPADWTFILGLGSFSYTGLKDTPPANITAGAAGSGNTLDINGNYPANFDIDEVSLEVKKKWGAVDLTAFYEGLKNRNVSLLNKASAYGLQAGYKIWSFTWAQQEVEKDAVVALFTDSDFGGGVTSTRGQVYSLGCKVSKKVQLQYTVFANENSIDLIPQKYERSHLDLVISY